MKKLIAVVALCGIVLLGQKLADFKPYAQNVVMEKRTILSLDFEQELPAGMKMVKGYQVGRGFGENGNGGLFLKRGPGEEYVFSHYEVPGMKAGNIYRLRASVKLSGVKTKDGQPLKNRDIQVVGFDFHDEKNNYLSSA